MSFRRVKNKQDKWDSHCQAKLTLLNSTGLPKELFRTINLLEDFLRSGIYKIGDQNFSLVEMSDSTFLALEKFIEPVLDFQDAYPTLAKERFRRFKRYD